MDPKSKKKIIVLSILSGIVISRFLVAIWWFYYKAGGFFMLFGDSCSRTYFGFEWAQRGLINGFPHGHTWLPLHFFLLAIIFKLIPKLFIIPPILGSIFFMGTIIWVYRITKRLFNSKEKEAVALFACSIISFYPWFFHKFHPNWFFSLSLSGMSDPIFHFFILGGISLFLDFIYLGNKKCLFLSALLFLFSTALRYEGWGFVVIISIFLLIKFIKSFQKDHPDWFVFTCILMMYLFIPFWLYDQYRSHGNPLYFANWTFNIATYYGQDMNLLQRIFFYPTMLFRIDIPIVALSILGIVFAVIKKTSRKMVLSLLGIMIVYMFFLICITIFFGPVAFMSRPLAIVFLMLIPFVAYAVFFIFKTVFGHLFAVRLLIFLALFIMIEDFTILNRLGRFGFASDKTVEIGGMIKRSYQSGVTSSEEKVLVEMRPGPDMVYDFWAIKLFVPLKLLLDRDDIISPSNELKLQDNPSIFDVEDNEFNKYCKDQRIKLIILTSEKYVSKVSYYAKQIGENEKYKLFLLKNF